MPEIKVTDARLTECLTKGGVCPFCGSDKAECLNSESQDDVVIEKWACCTEDCPGNVRGWTQILSLSEIYVSEDDVAEGETGYSKGPVLPPLEVHELIYRDGTLDIKASHPVLMLFVEETARLFKECKGENFLTLTMEAPPTTDPDKSLGKFSVVIQKFCGKTPNEKLLEQDKIIADLRAAAGKLADEVAGTLDGLDNWGPLRSKLTDLEALLPKAGIKEALQTACDRTIRQVGKEVARMDKGDR